MMNRERLLLELARGFHRQMEPESVAYLLTHFGRAMVAAGITEVTPDDLGVHRFTTSPPPDKE